MTLSRMGIYRGESFERAGHWTRGDASWRVAKQPVVCVVMNMNRSYAFYSVKGTTAFREWFAQKLSDDHGGYWVVTPREGDPRTMDVHPGVVVVAWYGCPTDVETYGPVLASEVDTLIAGIEQEFFQDDPHERTWDAVIRDGENEDGEVVVDMVRRPASNTWEQKQWQRIW